MRNFIASEEEKARERDLETPGRFLQCYSVSCKSGLVNVVSYGPAHSSLHLAVTSGDVQDGFASDTAV